MTHFGARKTQAQRDAIDERARDYPRPLSPGQRLALQAMSVAPLRYITTRGGTFSGTWSGVKQATIEALHARYLCRIEGKQRPRAVITGKGRKELARG